MIAGKQVEGKRQSLAARVRTLLTTSGSAGDR
jgi:hypothetical protein